MAQRRKQRILILLNGGLVEQVFSEEPLEVYVLDPDTEGADDDEIGIADLHKEPERFCWRHMLSKDVPKTVNRVVRKLKRAGV